MAADHLIGLGLKNFALYAPRWAYDLELAGRPRHTFSRRVRGFEQNLPRGHRRLAYVSRGGANARPAALRSFALSRAAPDAGMRAAAINACGMNDDSDESAALERTADALLSPDRQPTGLFVEEQPPAARHRNLAPAAARIGVRPEVFAWRAVEQLVWRMNNPDAPEQASDMRPIPSFFLDGLSKTQHLIDAAAG
jgi:hypothetical protein